jgi:sporulation protein YlmC with PRC-barrel domain
MGRNACERLISTLEQRQAVAQQPVSMDQARTYQMNNNQQACRDALQRVHTAGNAQEQRTDGQIVIQQPAPHVRVDQANPQVTVNQPQPQVTVQQPRPEITVRMPPPTITVQQPQPEIVMRMPNPQVNVRTPQPQVSVDQPQPKVQIVQPQQQADVQVERSQAQVKVRQPDGQRADVQVDRPQEPRINFEQTGKPKVQYNVTGKPKVTFEQADADASGQTGDAAAQQADAEASGQAGNAAAQQADADAPDQTGNTDARQNAVAAQSATTGAANSRPQSNVRSVAVERLKDMNLYNVKGNDLGDVERVVLGQQGKTYIVIGHGGFLGLGEKRVAIPLENVWSRGDRLITRGLTDDQIKAMPDWTQQVRNYRDLDDSQSAQISLSE